MDKANQEPEAVNVSALNQYSYCPRRCALIYLENQFTDNVHTMRGNAEHARVDRVAHVTTKDAARIEYALPVWSDALGLIGKCDVVEFWPDGTMYPVEYKHGPNKRRENDDLQLAAHWKAEPMPWAKASAACAAPPTLTNCAAWKATPHIATFSASII